MTTTTATTQRNHAHRHHHLFRKDLHMQHIELRLADCQERQLRFRALRDADRAALAQARSIRHRIGQSLIGLGRRVGGDALTSPAWQG
jgi:hypothetical protein